ncbi:nucleotide exchange factor GrpE [Rubrobacter calidifluminis]|uniref:nucleotide exchange factor GrpE n=1 Tax=Rubrobacter calidifluminis TaxID=1392640 RepID=UPI002362D7D5|nr:nucleotide exchange factor GrpE [Rubrobacter calidifluminis]
MSSEEKNERENEVREEPPAGGSVGEQPASAAEKTPQQEAEEVPAADAGKETPVVGGEGPGVKEEICRLQEELEATRHERDEYLDTLKRLKAEFENSRKRQERERAKIVELASERLVRELLPVLDNLERALESEGDIREGVRATRDQLLGVLEQEGLIPVASDGQHFDPSVHEAVMSQPSEEHEEGVIVQTFQRGYLLNGKPIRPAKVVVARRT